jgi:hypothetical protein
MRLISNEESVARGEVSILAIIETVLAIALVFYLSAHFNTLRWLAVAMCVSPLLLVRTQESTRLAVKWFDAWSLTMFALVRRSRVFGGPLVILVFLACAAASALAARVCATLVGAARSPIAAVSAVPRNWFRVSATMDFRVTPDFVPEHPHNAFSTVISELRTARSYERAWAFMALPFFLPSILYRLALKATSIIYAPLVFVARSTFSEGADLRTKLELIKRGDLSRIRVLYGAIAIAAFVGKLVLMMNLPGFANWWSAHPISQFAALYVAPSEIPMWQLAELVNSLLAIAAMLFARYALLRYDLQHPLPEAPVKRLLGFVSGLRWVLALYAICLHRVYHHAGGAALASAGTWREVVAVGLIKPLCRARNAG